MRGIAKTAGIGIAFALVLIVLLPFLASVFAAPATLTIKVVDIVTNQTINNLGTEANVYLINCSNTSQTLNSTLTTNGVAVIGINTAWNFSIRINATNFVELNDTNSSSCYRFATDASSVKSIYPGIRFSFNITVSDVQNNRPISNANVTIWMTDTLSENSTIEWNYDNNYRCSSAARVCNTSSSGNIVLFPSAGGSTTNYTINVKSLNYNTTNATYTGLLAGQNQNIAVSLKGASPVYGYITDEYNSLPVNNSVVSLMVHTLPGQDSLSVPLNYSDQYFYNSTTNENGYYILYAPSDLISGRYYDLKINSTVYTVKIDRNPSASENGYSGGRQISSTLIGLLNITINVTDRVNGLSIENARVDIIENGTAFTYTNYTNSTGGLLRRIRNSTGYNIEVSKTGYNANTSTTGINSSGTVSVTLLGLANVTGKVIDYIPSTAGEVNLSGTSIILSQSGKNYTTTTDSIGNFSVGIPTGANYTMHADKTGYFITVNASLVPSSGTNNLGRIRLYGKTKLYGAVYDAESGRYLNGAANRSLGGANVSVFDTTNSRTYPLTTDSSGRYEMNISSNSVVFYTQHNYSGYFTETKTYPSNNTLPAREIDLGTAYLTGKTRVNGSVADVEMGGSSTVFIKNANLRFTYLNSNDTLYFIQSDNNGSFSANLGVTATYKIEVSKHGYDTRVFNNVTGFEPYVNVSFNNAANDYLRLNGSLSVNGTVIDALSGYPVYNARVRIYKLADENPTYWKDVNGSFSFRVEAVPYKISAYASGYPEPVDNNGGAGYSTNLTKTINLTAQMQVKATDIQNMWGIKNARVQLYHFFNQTNFSNTINETRVVIAVVCSDNSNLSFNVSLDKTQCMLFQNASYLNICNRTQTTSNSTTTFSTVANGTYVIFVNGSSIGCGNITYTVSVTDMGITHNYTLTLNATSITVNVTDPRYVPITNATVWFATNSSKNCTTNSSGICTISYVINGMHNFTANHTNFFQINKNYSIANNLNDYTTNPIVMNPHPGNLSVYVTNGSGYPSSINVSVSNSSFANSTTTTNGWANFTVLASFFNVTANGTSQGYNYTNTTVYVLPDNNTELNITLGENTYLVTVLDGNGLAVNGSNITIFNATNGTALLGNSSTMSGLTNTSGKILFRRVIPGSYNLTISATGFNGTYSENINLTYLNNTKTVVINDTQSPAFSNVSASNSTPNQGDAITLSAYWTDNAALQKAILQLNDSGAWRNYTTYVFSGWPSSGWSDFSLTSAYTSNSAYIGRMIFWRIITADLAGNWNTTMSTQNFTIKDTQAPTISISHTPDSPIGAQEVTFVATGSDNLNITNITIFVDFGDVRSCVNTTSYPTSCTYTSHSFVADTWHYYYASAVDAEGNSGRDPSNAQINGTRTTTMSNRRSYPAAVMYGGINTTYVNKTFVFGGINTSGSYITAVEYFDAAAGSVTVVPGTNENRTNKYGMAASWSPDNDETIFLFGGYNDTYSRNIVKYNITSGNSTFSSTLLTSALSGMAAAFNPTDNTTYLFGGDNGTNYVNWTRAFSHSSETLTTKSNLTVSPRGSATAVYFNSTAIFVFGGFNGSDINEVVLFDPIANSGSGVATVVAYLPTGRFGMSAAYYQPNGNIYLFGGRTNSTSVYLSDIIEFNPRTFSVTTKDRVIGAARAYTSAVFNPINQTILVFGGQNNNTYYNTIFEYSPVNSKRFWIDPNYIVNVYVYDTDYNALQNVSVNLGGAENTSAAGLADFSVRSGTYGLSVNGTERGYGIYNTAVTVTNASITIEVVLNETKLNVYVYDNMNRSVPNANVTLYDNAGGIAKDASGNDVTGLTAANGWKVFSRMLPCNSCNLSISKAGWNPSSNSTIISITAGENKTVLIDPSVNGYYKDVINETVTLRVNVTNATATPLVYVNVSFYDADNALVISNLTDTNGFAFVSIEPGSYNITIEGKNTGFNNITRDVKVGKMVFANGTTNTDGDILLTVDGQPEMSMGVPGNGYYARIDAPGYYNYDSYSDSLIFRGTYYDETSNPNLNNSFRLNLTGTVILTGNVTDKYICGTHICILGSAAVRVRFHGGTQQGNIRYSNTTDSNGNYSFRISPYTQESTIQSPINATYDIEVVKSGYQDYDSRNNGYSSGIVIANNTNFTYSAGLSGSGSIRGYVYNIYGNPVANVPVRIQLYNTSYNPPYGSGDVIYERTTNTSGGFSFVANTLYSPYRIGMNPVNYENKLSGLYEGSQSGLEFRLYAAGHGGQTFNIASDTGETPQGINVSITGIESYNLTTDASGQAVQMQLGAYTYNATINGSYLGYGINQTAFTITAGNASALNVTLNVTRANATFYSLYSSAVDGLNITVRNITTIGTAQQYYASNITANGSALFAKLPVGSYNISLSGNMTRIYRCGNYTLNSVAYPCSNPNWTVINITTSVSGNTSSVVFGLNETRIYLNLTAENSSGISGLNVTVINNLTNETYSNSTYPYLFVVPAGNYSVSFNETGVYRKGFIPFNLSVEAALGNNTIVNSVIRDVQVIFNITNSTGGLGSINVTLRLNSTTATDGWNGANLTNTTGSPGMAVLRYVVPTSYAAGSYSYEINGNATGFGIVNESLTVGLNGVNVSRTLEPVTVIVYVRGADGDVLAGGVNVSILHRNLSAAANAWGQNLAEASVTNSSTLRYLHADVNYTAAANSSAYFARLYNFTSSRSNENYAITLTMSERRVVVHLYDLRGTVITENITVGIRNQTGVAINLLGQSLANTTTTGNVTFSNVSDNSFYNITANGTSGTGNYTTISNKTINTFTDNTTIVLYLKKNQMGYFNITTSPAGAGADLRYNGSTIDSGTSDSNGRIILWANTSMYNSSLYVVVSKSGYSDSTSGPYSLAELEVKNLSVSMSATSTGTTGTSGSGSGVAGSGACSENWTCSDWFVCIGNAQTRACNDLNKCNTTARKPATTRSCGAALTVEVADRKMSAGTCELLPVKIRNTGSVYLYNIKLFRDSTSSCCAVTQRDTIGKLSPQEEATISLQACSLKEAEKGVYSHTIMLISDVVSQSGSFEIEIERDYTEVLLSIINDLESEIERKGLSAGDSIARARGYATQKRFSEAEAEIDIIKRYISGKPFGLEWLFVLLIPAAIGGALLVFYFKTNLFVVKMKMPPRPYPLVFSKGLLLSELSKIEHRISRIDVRRLEEREMQHYNKVKDLLESVRYHVSANNFVHAKRVLTEMEQYLKFIEYGMFSGFGGEK